MKGRLGATTSVSALPATKAGRISKVDLHQAELRRTTSGMRKVYLRSNDDETTLTELNAIARLAQTCEKRKHQSSFTLNISFRLTGGSRVRPRS